MNWRGVVGLLGLAACATEPAVVVRPIVGGTFEPNQPAVVGITDGFRVFCTGTLISRRVVITAAHCVDPAITEIDPEDLIVYFGADFDRGEGLLFAVEEGFHHPEFDDADFQNDIGALLLATDGPVPPVPFLRESFDDSFLGQPITFVGFGVPDALSGDSGLKRTVDSSIVDFNETQFFYEGNAGTCFGDSGGPAFLARAGGDIQIGVTSFGDGACSEFGADTRLDAYAQNFIDLVLAEEPPAVEGCTLDGECQACEDFDPDCALFGCEGGNECNRACPGPDPDCPDISCSDDGFCDDRCADPGLDPDCACIADGACNAECEFDPDCGGCGVNPGGEDRRGLLAPLGLLGLVGLLARWRRRG